MQVETYEQTESTSEGVECDAEALKLIESLGLTGQQDLVTRPDSSPTRNPYRKMTREEEQVYGLLMPKATRIDLYNDGPIPLRVLQVAAHAKGMFDELVIWCPETGPKDDPILIGANHDKKNTWMTKDRFLLARWGESLVSFEKLKAKACKLAHDRVRGCLGAILAETQAAIASLDSMGQERLLKLAIEKPSLFIGQ